MCRFANVPKLVGILNLEYYVIFVTIFSTPQKQFKTEKKRTSTNKKFIFSVKSKHKKFIMNIRSDK